MELVKGVVPVASSLPRRCSSAELQQRLHSSRRDRCRAGPARYRMRTISYSLPDPSQLKISIFASNCARKHLAPARTRKNPVTPAHRRAENRAPPDAAQCASTARTAANTAPAPHRRMSASTQPFRSGSKSTGTTISVSIVAIPSPKITATAMLFHHRLDSDDHAIDHVMKS